MLYYNTGNMINGGQGITVKKDKMMMKKEKKFKKMKPNFLFVDTYIWDFEKHHEDKGDIGIYETRGR